MVWRVEYTNHPFLEKKLRKALEKALEDAAVEVEVLLAVRENTGFVLGDSGFSVESAWLPGLGKHHLGVRCEKRGDSWVATLTFPDRGTMTLDEVKRFLGGLGLNECSLTGLGVTNEKTVGQRLTELRESTSQIDLEECVRQANLATADSLEGWLYKGTIRLNDGLLDALIKIQKAVHPQPAKAGKVVES